MALDECNTDQDFWFYNPNNVNNFPLDNITQQLLFGYSVRKLASRYSGPAIRVRRSSDNAEADIGFAMRQQTRRNILVNPGAIGAVVGSPGTIPDTWFSIPATGTSREVVSVGVLDGMNYVDVRFFGTPSATSTFSFGFSPNSLITGLIPASPSTIYTSSVGVQIIAGATTNMSNIALNIDSRTAVGAYLSTATQLINLDAFLQRKTIISTTNASAGALTFRFSFLGTISLPFDITLRFALPNVELGTGNVMPLNGANIDQPVALRNDLDLNALSAHVGSGDGFITTWYDQSGNNLHVTQPTLASQPQIVFLGGVNTKNFRPSVNFVSATGQFLASATFTGGQIIGQTATTIMAVSSVTSLGTGRFYGYRDGVGYIILASQTGTQSNYFTRSSISSPSNNFNTVSFFVLNRLTSFVNAYFETTNRLIKDNYRFSFNVGANTMLYAPVSPADFRIGDTAGNCIDGNLSELIGTTNSGVIQDAGRLNYNANNYFRIPTK